MDKWDEMVEYWSHKSYAERETAWNNAAHEPKGNHSDLFCRVGGLCCPIEIAKYGKDSLTNQEV